MTFSELYEKWVAANKCLALADEEAEMIGKYRRCSKGVHSLPKLPIEAYNCLLPYLEIYNSEWKDNLFESLKLLQTKKDDHNYFDESDTILDRLQEVKKHILTKHADRFASFAVYRRCFGLPHSKNDDSKICLPEEEVVRKLLLKVTQELQLQHHRWSFASKWLKLNDKIIHTSCFELANTVKQLLTPVEDEAASFAVRHPDDPLVTRIITELTFISTRYKLIANLGSPSVTKSDCKHMFLSLGLPFDSTVSDDYAQSVTFHQAITLGLFKTSRMRGYIWEDNSIDDTASAIEAAEKVVEKWRQQKIEQERQEAAEKELREKIGRETGCEKIKSLLQCATHEVGQRMGQRLWTIAERESAMTEHRWAGCELCNANHMHFVAVPLTKGSTPALILCEACLPEYQSPVIARNYVWLSITDVIDRNLESSITVKELAAAAAKSTPLLLQMNATILKESVSESIVA